MRIRFLFVTATLLGSSEAVYSASCKDLTSIRLPHTTITSVRSVTAGALKPSDVTGGLPNAGLTPTVALQDVPEFCRIAAVLKPTQDSNIKIEVWLPTSSTWNGKFMAMGNGGWAGAVSTSVMSVPLSRGYAVASTDTGHEGTGADASFAVGHPEKLTDFAYRAVHEMTLTAKALVKAYYGNSATRSYWNGCSTGGRQGLKEAQRYPDDFDGIVAGAPANYMTHLPAYQIWVAEAVHKDEASYIPPEKYPVIHNAAIQACDAKDGVKDGVIEDPTRCKFDPKVIQCNGADAADCLTAAQVEAARKIYRAAVNPRTKTKVFPPLMPGSELGWAIAAGPKPGAIAESYWKNIVFQNPNWDFRTLDFDEGVARADKLDNGSMNAIDPNLKSFFGRGGKLIQYHGWSDNQIPPLNSIDYYETVVNTMGGASKVSENYRLFMVPGMSHCRAGEGVNSFDTITALEQWVENGKAPQMILGSRVVDEKTQRTRPLCPYPQMAVYNGSGSTDDAANFTCRAK